MNIVPTVGAPNPYVIPGILGKERFTLQSLESVISEVLHVPIAEMRSKTRLTEPREARQIFFYFAAKFRKNLPAGEQSDVAIGRYYNKNHSTVIHSVKKIQDSIGVYVWDKKRYSAIEATLRSHFQLLITQS